MSLYKFIGKKGHFYDLFSDNIIKLNFNCPKEYKDGEGQGSCKGYKPGGEKPEKKAQVAKHAVPTNKPTPATTSISKISTSQDYKSASPEQKAEFLRSEISKGKKSTTLSDGTTLINIGSKLKSIEKKITNKSNNIPIKQVKSVIAKVKKEQASGKVSKKTITELKDAINSAKVLPKTTNIIKATKNLPNRPRKTDISKLYIVNNSKLLNDFNITDTKSIISASKNMAEMNLMPKQYSILLKMEEYLNNNDNNDDGDMVRNNIKQIKAEFVSDNDHMDSSEASNMFDSLAFFVTNKINTPIKVNNLKYDDPEINKIVTDSKTYLEGTERYFKSYTSIEYEPINVVLCGAECSGKLKNINEFQTINTIANMDKAFEKASLASDLIVYRGVSPRQIKNLIGDTKDLSKLIGKTIKQPVFGSTSRDRAIAKKFAREKDGYIYEINLPKGSKAIALDTITEFTDEQEILLDRDSELIVDDVDESKVPPVIKLTYR